MPPVPPNAINSSAVGVHEVRVSDVLQTAFRGTTQLVAPFIHLTYWERLILR